MALNTDQQMTKSLLEITLKTFKDLEDKSNTLKKMEKQLYRLWTEGLIKEEIHDALKYGTIKVSTLIENHKASIKESNGKMS
tara:strand:- start:214 stop:459 length:246 start_codon:yes stop_codon:yes gene_type:complete